MKVALASTSWVKVAACQKALADVPNVELVTFKAPSGISEQPLNEETLRGAFNRIEATEKAIPDADLYVSIESGLFEENGDYFDRAVVTVKRKGAEQPQVSYSDGVKFPLDCVNEARKRGFDIWTVGKVMAERGIVKLHDDPTADLSGKPRAVYIQDALQMALSKFELK